MLSELANDKSWVFTYIYSSKPIVSATGTAGSPIAVKKAPSAEAAGGLRAALSLQLEPVRGRHRSAMPDDRRARTLPAGMSPGGNGRERLCRRNLAGIVDNSPEPWLDHVGIEHDRHRLLGAAVRERATNTASRDKSFRHLAE